MFKICFTGFSFIKSGYSMIGQEGFSRAATDTWQRGMKKRRGEERRTTWNWTHLRCAGDFLPFRHWFWISLFVSVWRQGDCKSIQLAVLLKKKKKKKKRLRSWCTQHFEAKCLQSPKSTCCFHKFTSPAVQGGGATAGRSGDIYPTTAGWRAAE